VAGGLRIWSSLDCERYVVEPPSDEPPLKLAVVEPDAADDPEAELVLRDVEASNEWFASNSATRCLYAGLFLTWPFTYLRLKGT